MLCVTIVALIALFALTLWPNLVTASNDPANSLTLSRAASSERTLRIMLIALIGMPLVVAYTTTIYWTFRGEGRGFGSGLLTLFSMGVASWLRRR